MEISFQSKYKSITPFSWKEIPEFVVLTGPNGTGKSQLLDLIYNTILDRQEINERAVISGKLFRSDEIIYLKAEWLLQNTSHINLSTIQSQLDSHFSNFRSGVYQSVVQQPKLFWAVQDIMHKAGKNADGVTQADFAKHFPDLLIEQESQLSQKIAEVFYNYRLAEIELLAKNKSHENIVEAIGEKPWVVLREILKESKLPFDINDPSENGFRDYFQLNLTNQITNEVVNFSDLSSGEKVLISLVFFLYNSQEKNVFPKLLLLDEPDAHLHPSMAQQFLNVVHNVLVRKFGVQVIMTTHSPSTVMLAPDDSIFLMSGTEPRIRKSPTKNHAVALLTAGLVYVGEGTKFFLVEDTDDVNFYSYIYNKLVTENHIDATNPLVFIPASTKDKSGGKDVVQNWVNKLQGSGLINIVYGLIDADSGNEISDGVFKIDRYSIENYLADPIIVYAALMDKEKNPPIEDFKLSIGEEYKLKALPNDALQKIVESILSKVQPELLNCFPDLDFVTETELIELQFVGGVRLSYPKWLLNRRGKTILNELYNKVFSSTIINFSTLFKALRKLNMFPVELIHKFSEIKS